MSFNFRLKLSGMKKALCCLLAIVLINCGRSTSDESADSASFEKSDSVLRSEADGANETKTVVCTFESFSMGDCPHTIFDCGDFGVAEIDMLSEEEKNLWFDLISSDTTQDQEAANPKFVSKKFEIVYNMIEGYPCQPGYGYEEEMEKGQIFNLLSFKRLD
jgi:hypothetical protein